MITTSSPPLFETGAHNLKGKSTSFTSTQSFTSALVLSCTRKGWTKRRSKGHPPCPSCSPSLPLALMHSMIIFAQFSSYILIMSPMMKTPYTHAVLLLCLCYGRSLSARVRAFCPAAGCMQTKHYVCPYTQIWPSGSYNFFLFLFLLLLAFMVYCYILLLLIVVVSMDHVIKMPPVIPLVLLHHPTESAQPQRKASLFINLI